MSEQEQALERARSAVSSMRAAGAYGEDTRRTRTPEGGMSHSKLLEWAVIEPDLRCVRSTRRFGALPVALKHGLLRLLAQYHGELTSQQTRFNLKLLDEVGRLGRRLDVLERRVDEAKGGRLDETDGRDR